MIDAHTDPALVAAQIVDTVGNRFAQLPNQEIVHAHRFGLSLRPPLSARVLEVPDQLLLLRVQPRWRVHAGAEDAAPDR